MNFLNPSLFAVLAPLLALPLLIHLFNRKFPHSIPFPDIARIKRSLSERSSLLRWRHWLMTLLRTLAIACLLFAFLKPVIPKFGSQNLSKSGRRILLIIDRSPSMLHRQNAATSAARNSLSEAGKILSTLKPGDQVNAILAGSSAKKLLPDFTSVPDTIRVSLASLPTGYERIDVKKALTLANTLLQTSEEKSEIYLLSDFQRSNWASASFDGLSKSTRLFFVKVTGEKKRANHAVLSAELSSSTPTVGALMQVAIQLANWSSETASIPVEALIDERASVSGQLTLAPWSTGQIKLDFTAPSSGIHRIEIKIPSDHLNADNRRFVSFEVEDREEVLILSDSHLKDSGAMFIEAALNPFNKGGAFTPRIIPSSKLTPARFSSASRIALTGVTALTPELSERLLSFLEQGGGMLYFLNSPSDQQNLLTIDKAFGSPVVPFHIAGTLSIENFGGKPQRIARGDFDSRFLRLFRGENRQILGLLEFYKIRRALPSGEGEILLYFADGTPALGLAHIGLGTAVFCNFSPAELSSNLARQRLFPAWIHELVKNLNPEPQSQLSQTSGDTLTAELWRTEFESGTLLDPERKKITARISSKQQRISATFRTHLPGFYRFENGENLIWQEAVNLHPDESDLRSLQLDELKKRAANSLTDESHQVEGLEDYAALSSGQPIFHWFLFAIALLLCAEMLLQGLFQRASGS